MPAIGMRGEITTSLFLPDGTFLCSETKENHITNDGVKALAGIVTGLTPLTFEHIQIGTGGETWQQLTDPETGALLFTAGGDPVMGNVFKQLADGGDPGLFTFFAETDEIVKSVGVGTYGISANFKVPLNIAVNEAGIFSSYMSSTPIMLAKQVFSNTIKMWQARRNATQSVVTGDYIILNISWRVFFGRDPQYEPLYDPDFTIVMGERAYGPG